MHRAGNDSSDPLGPPHCFENHIQSCETKTPVIEGNEDSVDARTKVAAHEFRACHAHVTPLEVAPRGLTRKC